MAAKLEDSKHKLQIWLINDSLTLWKLNLVVIFQQLASHGLFDVHVKATDVHIDDHHTNEDALLQALGDRKGINRVGNFSAPLDEALIHVSLDLSGRPHLSYNLEIPRVGTYDRHFFESLVNTSGMTLHIWQAAQLAEKNSHRIIEARQTFKAFVKALRQAT
ncbi:hypothetical protein JHK85_004035 [Glycine max]|nr:hypothetical protein JHK85_004035 [Glycine max]